MSQYEEFKTLSIALTLSWGFVFLVWYGVERMLN